MASSSLEGVIDLLRKHQYRRYWILLSVGIVIFLISIFQSPTTENFSSWVHSHDAALTTNGEAKPSADLESDAINATLGFQKILALSTGTPWRVDGLKAAANLTGLDIEISIQDSPTPEQVVTFQDLSRDGSTRPGEGNARAWMAHLQLLKKVVEAGLTTAFIVEDDVDWDVALREKVMLPLAKGVRNYTNASFDDISTPYGGHWDVLWMGHCGEWSHEDMPYLAWPDETMIPHEEYVGWAAFDMKERPLPEGMRTTHPTTTSVCTFAYGVTSGGASKILDRVHGDGQAFDVELSEACRVKKLTCVTIHPEIFHQYRPPNDFGQTSEIALENEGQPSPQDYPTRIGTTPNIRNSARCAALFNATCQELP